MTFDNYSDAELQSRMDGLAVDQETRALLDEVMKRWLAATDTAGTAAKADYDFRYDTDQPTRMFR